MKRDVMEYVDFASIFDNISIYFTSFFFKLMLISMLFQVVINTEWGAFGNNGCLDFIVSEYDKGVDQISKNPKQQM